MISPEWLFTDPTSTRAKGWQPKPNGSVKLVKAWGPPESIGAGAAGDDWYSDPSINTPVAGLDNSQPAPQDGAATPSGDSGSSGFAENEAFRAPASISPARTVAAPTPAPVTHEVAGAGSPSPDQGSFVDTLLPDALSVSDETGIPWQALVAIPANETGWGKSVAANNYFGIKGTGPGSVRSATWEVQNGQRVNTTASFAGFSGAADSMRGFAQFLQQNPRYQTALDYLKQNPDDWQGFVTRVGSAGYATDPSWASKIISIGSQLDGPAHPPAALGQPPTPVTPVTGSSIVDVAQTAIGSKYLWGGPGGRTNFDPNFAGSDCSGFVSWAYYNSTGVKLPAQTASIYAMTQPISKDDAKPGDLIEFNMNTNDPHEQHVAIYAGNGMMIHDSSVNPDGGVELTPVWQGQDVEYRRVPGVDPDTYMNHPGLQDPNAASSAASSAGQAPDHMFDPEGNLWVINPDGTATMGKPLAQPGQPDQDVGTGADVGAGDDWYSDPSINTQDTSPPSESDASDGGGGSFLDEIGRAKDAVTQAAGGAVQAAGNAVTSAASNLVAAPGGPTPAASQPMPSDALTNPIEYAKQNDTAPAELPDITSTLQVDPNSNLGKIAQGQKLSAPEQLAAAPEVLGGYEQSREAATEALNPARDVPVLGGAINAATDPLSYVPADRLLAGAGRVVKAVAPAADTALTRAASAVARSPLGRVPGVVGATEGVARAPAQASTRFAMDVAGGVGGAIGTSQHVDANDPDRIPKILAGGAASMAATHVGTHFLIDSGVGPATLRAWDRIFAPGNLLTDDEKALYVKLANMENSAKVQGGLWRDRIKDALGSDDNLQWAMGHEEHGANNPLIRNPKQAQLSSDMIDFTNKTGNIGRQEGFITGDVTAGTPASGATAPAVHFPHVYDEGLTTARRVAQAKGGYNPMDTYSFQRTHANLIDAVGAGLKPVDSVSGPYSMYARRVLSSQAKSEFLAGFKKLGNSPNLIHVATAGHVPDDLAALGWTSGKKWSPRLQNIAVSPDMKHVLDNLYEPSHLRNAPVIGGFTQGLGEIKQILLGGSGFHGGNLIRQFIASNGQTGGEGALAGIMWQGATPGGFRKWALDNMDDIVEAADWGVILGGSADRNSGGINSTLAGLATRGAAGGAFGGAAGYFASKDDPSKNAFQEALKGAALGAVGAASTRLISDAVFGRYLPMMKVSTFQLMKNTAGPEAAAQFVNDAFGGQNIAAMGRSRTVQDALRVIALAPDWQEGWIKQVGNALKPGSLGDLNRQYWSNALVQHAVFLEGMNTAINGHMSQDNGTGHELDLELTGLYDRAGWDHTDPSTGEKYRVYASILGPYKGMLAPLIEAGQAALGQPGHNAGTVGASVANLAGARMGILPQEIGALTSDTDWKGDPVVPRGTDPWKAAALRIGQSLARIAPIGVQTETQTPDVGPAGFISATTGTRVTKMTPTQEQFKQRQALIDQAGRTPAELQTLNENYSQQLADNDKAAQDVYSGVWKAPGGKTPTHGEMDQQLVDVGKQRPKYAEHINSMFPANLFGGDAAKQADFTKLVQSLHPGIAGAPVPADLPENANPDDAYNAYWGVGQDQLAGLTPSQQNTVRGKALVQWALTNNVDYQTALDAVKAKSWGGGTPPKLPDGVTSETVDSWVSKWGDAPDEDSKRAVIDDIANTVLPGDPHGPDTVWQRIKLRMMPPQQPSELQVSRDKALDVLFASRDPKRFPAYMDQNYQPIGNPDMWKQWDAQIANAGKKVTPEIKALVDERDRASMTRKKYILDNVNGDDYQRWFGIGKTMTDDQWQRYKSGGYPHYSDTKDAQETLNRDQIEQQWQAATHSARVTTKVVIDLNGVPTPMTLQYAHLHIAHTISKGWAKALDIPGTDAVSSGGTNGP